MGGGAGDQDAAFVVPNNTFGTGLTEAAVTAFEAGGGKVIRQVAYTEGQPDYRADIQPVVQAKPEAIIAAGYGDDSPAVFSVPARSVSSPLVHRVSHDLLHGESAVDERKALRGRQRWPWAAKRQSAPEGYMDRYKEEPLAHVFYGYDAAMLLARAMGKPARTLRRIEAALPKVVQGYQGATGRIRGTRAASGWLRPSSSSS